MRIWRKGNTHALLLEMLIDAATMETSLEIPQKLKIEWPYDLTIQLLGVYRKKQKY